MSALHYEYLICRAHQKRRYGSKGADADIFRELQANFWEYKSEKEDIAKRTIKGSLVPIGKMEVKYNKKANEVKGYIEKAINHVLKNMETGLIKRRKANCRIVSMI